MSALPKLHLSPTEYLTAERRAKDKSEYWNGEVFAMAGASPKHNLITSNVTITIGMQLKKGGRCTIFPSDMRIFVPATGLYTYADALIVCGRPQFVNDDNLFNPTVIIEVLSKSTSTYDRGTKFHNYRTIESLKEYLLIDQYKQHIEHYARQSDNRWLLTDIDGLGATIELPSLDCSLTLADIYDGVDQLNPSRILKEEEPEYDVAARPGQRLN